MLPFKTKTLFCKILGDAVPVIGLGLELKDLSVAGRFIGVVLELVAGLVNVPVVAVDEIFLWRLFFFGLVLVLVEGHPSIHWPGCCPAHRSSRSCGVLGAAVRSGRRFSRGQVLPASLSGLSEIS